jgi:hypothetical protein
LPERDLGAVVLCAFGGVPKPTIGDLTQWSTNGRHWKIGESGSCFIATPEAELGLVKPTTAEGDCQANIEFAGEKTVGSEAIRSVSGWITTAKGDVSLPGKAYISLTKKEAEPTYFEAQEASHVNVTPPIEIPHASYGGFSRIMNRDMPDGDYAVGVGRFNNGRFEMCRLPTGFSINVSTPTLHIAHSN